jgi:hypothetical protein
VVLVERLQQVTLRRVVAPEPALVVQLPLPRELLQVLELDDARLRVDVAREDAVLHDVRPKVLQVRPLVQLGHDVLPSLFLL